MYVEIVWSIDIVVGLYGHIMIILSHQMCTMYRLIYHISVKFDLNIHKVGNPGTWAYLNKSFIQCAIVCQWRDGGQWAMKVFYAVGPCQGHQHNVDQVAVNRRRWVCLSILTWHRGYHDHLGGSSRVRPFHCTTVWLTFAITPNVGDSGAQFLLVGDCVRAIPL